MDALLGHHERASAGDAPFDAQERRGWCWWRAGGAGVADAVLFGRGERVGQAAQQGTVVDELEQAAVEADGEPAAGEVDADGMAAAGEAMRPLALTSRSTSTAALG
jgi:hypothetical protein